MEPIYTYHVVTERPMYLGQELVFDLSHRNGVGKRVYEKIPVVQDIYAHPENYKEGELEHHTSVALRELALEEVREKYYPQYPSRMACLYVSRTLEEAEKWFDFFKSLGRPTYQIVKLKIEGNLFFGNATRCFDGRLHKEENLKLAEAYWENPPDSENPEVVVEGLADGVIKVMEVIRTSD